MTTFRVWAPGARRVDVDVAGRRHPMVETGRGWWNVEVSDAVPGTDYGFVLDGGPDVLPDPRSPWQPHGVHGRSRVVDHATFPWTDADWPGRDLVNAVCYELHLGTFTPQGTADAAVTRLGHLVDLGVTHVEVMPVHGFPGRHGWGYDGVDLYAPHEPYGGPDALKRFVDACHAHGLAVVLDVVYNHLGPSGDYLDRFGPYYTDAYRTPWGRAVNYDDAGSDEVRAFAIDNAVMWLRDYHVDGLRLDAVHAINDRSAVHLLEAMQLAVERLSDATGRPHFLVAESDLNDPRVVAPRERGGYALAAQWSDDFHHALHAALTGERSGYYVDYGGLADVAKALREVFCFDGRYSVHRGRSHGRPVQRLPGTAFVGYLQNHDQVGNRAAGDRSSDLLSDGLLRVGAALVLCAPTTPMLFQGEEWGARTPFQYFTDHAEDELAEAVRTGRREEFRDFGWRPDDVPDPQDVATYERSKLDWTEPGREPHAGLLAWHRELIALRRREPDLHDGDLDRVRVDCDETRRGLVLRRGGIAVAANLSDAPQQVRCPGDVLLLASAPGVRLGGGGVELPPESVAVTGPAR